MRSTPLLRRLLLVSLLGAAALALAATALARAEPPVGAPPAATGGPSPEQSKPSPTARERRAERRKHKRPPKGGRKRAKRGPRKPPPVTWYYRVDFKGDATSVTTSPSGVKTTTTATFRGADDSAKLVRSRGGRHFQLLNCCGSAEFSNAVSVTQHPTTQTCGSHVDSLTAHGSWRQGVVLQGRITPVQGELVQVLFQRPPSDAKATHLRTGYTCVFPNGSKFDVQPLFEPDARAPSPTSCFSPDADSAVSGGPLDLGHPFALGVVCRWEIRSSNGSVTTHHANVGMVFESCPAPRGERGCPALP